MKSAPVRSAPVKSASVRSAFEKFASACRTVASARRRLARAGPCRAAGLGWEPTAHDLRHFYASRLIQQGVDVVRVSGYLGHATVTKTLNVYGHLIFQDHSDVDAALAELPSSDGL